MEGTPEVLSAADELYGLLPEEFTAAREARVRALRDDGAREQAAAVKALRRPSVAAWLVNALVRHRTDEVEQLLALGEALREAQETLDADQLRELGRQRQAVLSAIGRQARALARELGRPVTEPVADEVEETLRAGLSDPAAATAVRSGRLTTALHYAGFGQLDLSDVVALADAAPSRPARTGPSRPPAPGSPEADGADGTDDAARRAEAREAAVREAQAAVRRATEAVRHAEVARRSAEQHRDAVRQRVRSARERMDAADARVAELEAVLASARETAAAAAAGWTRLDAEEQGAVERAGSAADAEAAARTELEAAGAALSAAEAEHRA